MIEGLSRMEGPRAPAAPDNLVFGEVARLCVGAGADLCAVYLRSSPGAPVAFEVRSPGQCDVLTAAAFDDLYVERARDAGLDRVQHRTIFLDGTAVGAIVLGATKTNASAAITSATLDALSTILASAIAQAEQLAHHRRVSDRLQRAMLPARLVEAEGIRFDAAYRPASSEAEVGGDWYDTFEIGHGKIGLSVGDVTGHGLEAAVTMAEIRHAIRAAALAHAAPSAVLDAVESVVTQGTGMATAIFGLFDPGTAVLRYACAGHPPPILLTSHGEVHVLPGGGTLLGLDRFVESPEWTVTIAPGSTCFLYTDGLIENERDILAGEERLLHSLESMAKDATRSASELHARVIGDGPSDDDCATLMLHREHARVALVERYTFSSVPAFAFLARDAVRNFSERLHLAQERQFELLTAAGEAIANAIEHGTRAPESTFTIELMSANAAILLHVESAGHWRATPAQTDRGRGIPIMNACARSLEISSTSERTRVILTFDASSGT